MARRFFYVCAGLLMLAAAYDLGAMSAESQAPGNSLVAAEGSGGNVPALAFTANGDVFVWTGAEGWQYHSNVFAGGPMQTRPETWGGVKERFGR